MYFLTFHPMACRWQGSGKPSFSEARRKKEEGRIASERLHFINAG